MYSEDRTTIKDRREMLRVKLKSLAEEARIIRREEARIQGPLREELHLHRIIDVRTEARATHLAYGLIKGRSIEQMEPHCTANSWRPDGRPPHDGYLYQKVRAMLKKYGPANFVEPDLMRK